MSNNFGIFPINVHVQDVGLGVVRIVWPILVRQDLFHRATAYTPGRPTCRHISGLHVSLPKDKVFLGISLWIVTWPKIGRTAVRYTVLRGIDLLHRIQFECTLVNKYEDIFLAFIVKSYPDIVVG